MKPMIITKFVKSTPTNVYTANKDNEVVTFINCANLDSSLGHPITLYIVPDGKSPSDENVIIKQYMIAPTDCLQMDLKLVLSKGDSIFAQTDQDDRLNCTVSVAIPPSFT